MSEQLQQQQQQSQQLMQASKIAGDKIKQQGGSVDILKNTVISSLLPLELPILDILFGKSGDVMPSLLNNSKIYGIISAMSARKPTSFFLSLFGAVIDLDTILENLKKEQEKDKFGTDYRDQQQHTNDHNPIGNEQYEQQKQQHSHHNQQDADSHHRNQQQGPSEIDKFKEIHDNQQRMNHQNHNHNNHYDAHQFWKHQGEIMEAIRRKHEDHFRALKHVQQIDDQEYQHEQKRKQRR